MCKPTQNRDFMCVSSIFKSGGDFKFAAGPFFQKNTLSKRPSLNAALRFLHPYLAMRLNSVA